MRNCASSIFTCAPAYYTCFKLFKIRSTIALGKTEYLFRVVVVVVVVVGGVGLRRHLLRGRRRVGLGSRRRSLLVQRARSVGVILAAPHQVHVDDDPSASSGVIILSRAPGLCLTARTAPARGPLVLETVDHVLDGLELPGSRLGRWRGRGRRRPGAQGAPTAGRDRLEGRAVRGRVRGQGVGREPVALELVQRTGQWVRVVGEQRVLGRQRELGVQEHARGRDAPVQAGQRVWRQEVTRTGVEPGHRGVQVRQEGRVQRRPDRDVWSGSLAAVVARQAQVAALGARGFAAVAPVAHLVGAVAHDREAVVVVPRPGSVVVLVEVLGMRRVRSHDVQELVVVVHEVVDRVRGAPLVR